MARRARLLEPARMTTRPADLIAAGHQRSTTCGGLVRVSVSYAPAVFAKLQALAREHGTSVAEQVRILTEIGLDEKGGVDDGE